MQKKKLKDLIKKERRKKRVIIDEEDGDDYDELPIQKKSKKLGELSAENLDRFHFKIILMFTFVIKGIAFDIVFFLRLPLQRFDGDHEENQAHCRFRT